MILRNTVQNVRLIQNKHVTSNVYVREKVMTYPCIIVKLYFSLDLHSNLKAYYRYSECCLKQASISTESL